MARFQPVPDLEQKIAAQIAAPAVRRLLVDMARLAAGYAPPVKVWHTEGDSRVRPWHVGADGQQCPDNLRFAVPHSPRQGHQAHHWQVEMLRYPRDPTAYYLQVVDCRCQTSQNDGLADSIRVDGPPEVSRAKVTGSVSTGFPRAAESEYGTSEDAPARYMRRALAEVRLR